MAPKIASDVPFVAGVAPLLHAKGVSRSFQMGDSTVHVLKNADLAVMPGEFVAIEGRSGSGKSTMLHILGALDAVDSGHITFNGIDYTRYTPAEESIVVRALIHRRTRTAAWIAFFVTNFFVGLVALILMWQWLIWAGSVVLVLSIVTLVVSYAVAGALGVQRLPEERAAAKLRNRDFGFVFQFYYLLPEMNVLENTALSSMIAHSWFGYHARKRELRAKATELLTDLGMGHRLKHRPNQLSGGERQRVAIARALMNDPKVLFADEPTGNLDADTGKQIMGVLEKLHREKGQTIVMVTHDRSLARKTDRVLVMRDGKLEKAEG